VPNTYGLQNENLVNALTQGQNILNKYLDDMGIATGQSVGYYGPYQTQLDSELHNILDTLKYLDNGIIRVGVNLDWGGAISEISHQGFNLIDDHDTGRLAQVAFYSGNSVWNPVQGGDKYNRGSPVLEYTVQQNLIYTKTQPIDWNTGELTDVYVEQWISLEDETVEVNYKMTHFGTEVYTFHDQEFPCAYVNKDLYRCITYCGSNPWTYDGVVDLGIQPQSPGSPNTYFYPTEYWASFVNDLDFGLTLYSKDHTAKWAANRFTIDTQPGYLATVDQFAIEPGAVEEATEYFIVGNYPDARNKIYSLEPTDDPTLSISPSTHNFGDMCEGETESTTFEIWNSGTGTLSYSLSESCSWIDAHPTSGSSTGEHDTITVDIDTTGLSEGSHTCDITISSNGGGGTFTVTVNVAPCPELSYSPTSHNFGDMREGETDNTTFEIWNSGTGTLSYSLSETCSWANVYPISGSSTEEHDTITVFIDTTGLSEGFHTCDITINSNDGSGTFTATVNVVPYPCGFWRNMAHSQPD
jgi:uncharacterized protein YprB with RNaseH-like and TPR domain